MKKIDLEEFEWTKRFRDRYTDKPINREWYTSITVYAENSGSDPDGLRS